MIIKKRFFDLKTLNKIVRFIIFTSAAFYYIFNFILFFFFLNKTNQILVDLDVWLIDYINPLFLSLVPSPPVLCTMLYSTSSFYSLLFPVDETIATRIWTFALQRRWDTLINLETNCQWALLSEYCGFFSDLKFGDFCLVSLLVLII